MTIYNIITRVVMTRTYKISANSKEEAEKSFKESTEEFSISSSEENSEEVIDVEED